MYHNHKGSVNYRQNNRDYQISRKCKFCGIEITFHYDIKTKRYIPLGLDNHRHYCEGNIKSKYQHIQWVGA